MKRKIISALLTGLLLVSLVCSVAASSLPLVIDNAQLFTADECAALETDAQSLRTQYETDVVILTVTNLDGKTAQDYADDYYDNNGYGYGAKGTGILFLLSMEEREWYISTCGDMIYAVTDYGIQQLGEEALWYLSDGEYYSAFSAYLDCLTGYLEAYQQGAPIDGYADYSGDYYHGDQEEIVYYEEEFTPSIFLSFIIGIIVASISLLIMRASMNTKRQQRSASGYMRSNSFHLRSHQDLFLYSNISKVKRQQNNTSGGGGSSVHRSSGGRRHGGGGGKF